MPEPLSKRNPSVPSKIETLITKALSKHPNDRFVGCGEFARELLKAVEGTESLIRCANCGTKNKIEKLDQVPNSKCTQCSQVLLSSVGAKTSSSRPTGWVIATVLLAIISIITIIGWAVTSDSRNKAQTARYNLSSQLGTAQTELNAAKTELETVKKERQSLQDKVNRYETTPATIIVSNESSIQVKYLYMNKKDEAFSGDRLGSSVLDPNQQKRFQVPPGTYKLQLKDKDGNECNFNRGIDVTAGAEKTIVVKNEPAIGGCKHSITY
jgi:DNA-directed RNA polymerase subunit RPC12/RpoP